ncbi:MAG: LytTR family DNA-binding domain-containing protein [Pseudomonadota bacterium]
MGDWVTATIETVRTVASEVLTRIVLFSWFVTTVIVSFAGPFGTYSTQPYLWRLAYWGSLIASAIVLAVALRVVLRSILLGKSAFVEDAAMSSSLALIFGTGVYALNMRLAADQAEQVLDLSMTILVTLGIAVTTVALRRWLETTVQPEQARDRLLDRINAPSGARLAKVSSDNHHIRITTVDGLEYRILMRLRDAVAQIDVEPGICVHRSHWVALAQINAVQQEGSKEVVTLFSGRQVPIGPKYRANLVESGLLSA